MDRAMLLEVLRRPVTRTNAEVTLLAEYAASAADEIERLDRQIAILRTTMRAADREAREALRDAAAEAAYAERMGSDYMPGCY